MNQVVEIELEKLHPFKNHPFHVSDDEKMDETVESIKNYGVLNGLFQYENKNRVDELFSNLHQIFIFFC